MEETAASIGSESDSSLPSESKNAPEIRQNNAVHYAGFWIRLVAHLIDFALVNAVEYALEWLVCTPLGVSAFVQQIVGVFFSVGLAYFYYVELPMRRGTTFGKQLFGIFVVDNESGKLFSRKQATIRLFGYIASYAIVGCGFLMAAFHPQKKGLHDLFASTLSVRRTRKN